MWMVGLSGSVVTIGIFVITMAFNLGKHSARIESLESWRDDMHEFSDHSTRLSSLEVWRGNVRVDMHEISEQMQTISNQITALTTLVQERTERRDFKSRPPNDH